MATLSLKAWQSKQEAADLREYTLRLDHVHQLESILGLPESTRSYTWPELLRRERNLLAQITINPDDPDELGQKGPIYWSEVS